MPNSIAVSCNACRVESFVTIKDLRAVGGEAYIECPACHYFNYFKDIQENFNG